MCVCAQFSLFSRDNSMAKMAIFVYDCNRTLFLCLSFSVRRSLSPCDGSSTDNAAGEYNNTIAERTKHNIKISTKLIYVHTKRRRSNCLAEQRWRRRQQHLHCMCPEIRAQHTEKKINRHNCYWLDALEWMKYVQFLHHYASQAQGTDYKIFQTQWNRNGFFAATTIMKFASNFYGTIYFFSFCWLNQLRYGSRKQLFFIFERNKSEINEIQWSPRYSRFRRRQPSAQSSIHNKHLNNNNNHKWMYESALCSRTKPSKRFECPTETDKKLRFVDFRCDDCCRRAVDCYAQCSHSHVRTPHKIHPNTLRMRRFVLAHCISLCVCESILRTHNCRRSTRQRSSVSMGTSKYHYIRVSVKKPGRYTL